MELARHAREGAALYDIGFPFLRSWLYGIGGFIVIAAAFAVGLVIARGGRPDPAEVKGPAIVSDRSADDVVVVRAAAETTRFPSFAPEGVIVVRPPARQEHSFAAADGVHERLSLERASSRRPARSAERRARSNVSQPPPATVERTEPSVEAPRQDTPSARNEAPAVREAEHSGDEDYEDAFDNRSWYGSAEYWREVQERRRAEREARRRRNAGG